MNRRIGIWGGVAAMTLLAATGVAMHYRSRAPRREEAPRPVAQSRDEQTQHADSTPPAITSSMTTEATWYPVPAGSLGARRAAPGEYTAAHDRLPLYTRLRVTHLGNRKSVIVRITDRCVPTGRAPLDLSKSAAEALDMIADGTAKVRVETLADDDGQAANPAPQSTGAPR